MSSALADCLVRDGLLPEETVRAALGRQLVYGGALDTVLLEMGVIDESTLWGALAGATGLPVPEPSLVGNAEPGLASLLGNAGALRLVVPLQRQGDRLKMMCANPVNHAAIREAARAAGLSVELFVAPEVRVRAAAQTVFGAPVPSRFLRLLARLVGSQPVRRWVSAQASPPPLPRAPISVVVTAAPPAEVTRTGATRAGARVTASRSGAAGPRPTRTRRHAAPPAETTTRPLRDDPADTVEGMAPLQQVLELSPDFADPAEDPPASSTDDARAETSGIAGAPSHPPPAAVTGGAVDEHLLRAAGDPAARDRVAALRALRVHLEDPRVRALAEELRADVANAPSERAVASVTALEELRDPAAVPVLIGRLNDRDATLTRAAHQALVAITKQDVGGGVRRWRAWWSKHNDDDRMDWLFAALSHRSTEVRLGAETELRALTGDSCGYLFDLPKREREEARTRWETWWLNNRGVSRG